MTSKYAKFSDSRKMKVILSSCMPVRMCVVARRLSTRSFAYSQSDAVSYDDYVDAPDVEAASMDEHIAEVFSSPRGGLW